MDKQLRIAVIADIISSKKVKERALIQKILSKTLANINKRFKSDLVSHMTITLGDEFQGIVKNMEAAFLIIDLITLELQLNSKKQLGEEISLRWGIGVGELVTPIQNIELSIGADGPAYWRAREAIEKVHRYDDYGLLNEKIVIDDDEEEFFNSIIRLQCAIRNQWTTSQKETAYYVLTTSQYEELENRVIKGVMNTALNQSFSEQTISKRLISTRIKQYANSRLKLAEKIEEWREQHDS